MNMSSADKKILLEFLNNLSERYSRAGCNDYTLPDTLSAEEKANVHTDVLKFVQSTPDFKNEDPIFAAKMVLGNDMLLVHYLVDKIEKS